MNYPIAVLIVGAALLFLGLYFWSFYKGWIPLLKVEIDQMRKCPLVEGETIEERAMKVVDSETSLESYKRWKKMAELEIWIAVIFIILALAKMIFW